ncbi:MAG: hypothetical protein HDT39_13720 [Lachnospiraceae bacterium]|nr:hypothetical protein [Lachnospiraceae bacterium]
MGENKTINTSTDCICYHCVNPMCELPHCESYNDEYCRYNLENKAECVKKECEYYLSDNSKDDIKECDDCICLNCTQDICDVHDFCDCGFAETKDEYIIFQADIEKCFRKICDHYR